MKTAAQILEQGKARRGEPFDAFRLFTMDGQAVCANCGMDRWRRAPLLDEGECRAWECGRDGCTMVLREVLG